VSAPLLSLRGLGTRFPIRNALGLRTGWLKAVDDVSFDLQAGETLGLVGESGCGKSSLGKTIIGINRPHQGEIVFQGEEIAHLDPSPRRAVARELQYVYQDPGASLDPRWKIGSLLDEPLKIHSVLDAAERRLRVVEILRAVGLTEAHLGRYPHEISGGQQRRVGLARILTLRPKLVILDEPTSGLDVSVQATVLKLFRELRQVFDLTYLFISHDLSVVRLMCDRVAVMYLGRIVELGPTAQVFDAPRHPYTRALLSALPRIGGRRVTDDLSVAGEPPSPTDLPAGCRFRPRCPLAQDRCAVEQPALEQSTHAAACHFA
jgi:oligopeptide/dipeptide ABC transporter ATP-binding protein